MKRVALLIVFAFGCSRAADIAADHPVASASASTSVVSSAATNPPASPPSTDEADMREATFRHMFRKNASGMQQGAKVFCLEFEKKSDPPPSFMTRFAHDPKSVRVGSACTQSASDGVVEKATNARGLAFRIDSVKFVDKDHATVNGGYYEAGLSASGNVYTLERQNGAWVVTKDEMTWIS